MHIGMLAPIAWRTPPRHYGPWERVVSLLTEGLVAAGAEVTLFATADAVTSAHLEAICPRPYAEDLALDAKVWECMHIAQVFEQAERFDLIHNHFDFLPLSYSRLTRTPLLSTIHGFSSERILPVYKRYNAWSHYVSISYADRHPALDYVATVYHGIDLSEFTVCHAAGEYLLFFGRIHPDKGVAEAIDVAKQSGFPLIIAGIIQDESYFKAYVAPQLTATIRYVGSVGPEARDKLLGGAYALLHLINFDEPFGLSMVEAMACGTPVIATRRGSVPELISHGKSGFIVDDAREAAAMLDAIPSLDRGTIREHVAQHFSQTRMVADYLTVYEQLLTAPSSHYK